MSVEQGNSVKHSEAEQQPTQAGSPRVVPVIEEQVNIEKEVVETGSVRLTKRVKQEEVWVDVPVTREELHVEHVPINQYVETPPEPVRYEGDTMIIPVLKEEIVVQKRLVLVEEVRVTRRRIETNVPQQVSLRKEEIEVDRTSPASANPIGG